MPLTGGTSRAGAAPGWAVTLPAHPGIVASCLSDLAQQGRKASTIGRRAASIGYHHKLAGHEPPTNQETVKVVLRGIYRSIGTARAGKAAATANIVRLMLDACPENTLIGLRDRALISFGLASAMRRSELCALNVEDLVPTKDGYRVIIRRSKTDQTGEGQEIAVPRGLKLRPVECMERWLEAAAITEGRVFRAVLRGGRVQRSLRPENLSKAVKKLAARIEIDPKTIAAHSLRSGFVSTCVETNAPLIKIAEVTRHKSLSMLQVYNRRHNLFADRAAAGWV